MAASGKDPLVGRLIGGRYLVAARIARGSTATVYRAQDHRLGRDVALKVVRPPLGEDPRFRESFADEARTTARLSHPHVVQVFDQDFDGDLCYLAMELLEGGTLRDYLRESGALAPREALDVLEPVLDALAAAHAVGIVHEDLKPENVIITEDGRIKVTDFGLSRASASTRFAPQPSPRAAAYLAPEILADHPADARSDVHAVGIMLFEMLTGRLPFTGETFEEIAQAQSLGDLPRPSSLAPQLTQAMDGFVLRACAHDPNDRPCDAAALAQTLRTVRANLPAAVLDLRTEPTRPKATAGSRAGRHRAAADGPAADASPYPVIAGAAVPTVSSPAILSDPQLSSTPQPPPTAPTSAPPSSDASLSDTGGSPGYGEPTSTAGQPSAVGPAGAMPVMDNDATHLLARARTPAGPLPANRPPAGQVPGHPLPEASGSATQMLPGPVPPSPLPYGDPTSTYPADPGHGGAWPGYAPPPYPDAYPQANPGWYQPEPVQPSGAGSLAGRVDAWRRMIGEWGRARVIGASALLVLLVLLAGWSWWVAAGPGAYRATPDVVGMSQKQATGQLAAQGLSSRTEDDYSDTVTPGTVLRTEPSPGGKVREHGRVTLFVCAGPRTVTVPPLQSKTMDEAVAALEKEHLRSQEGGKQYHDDIPLGSVISSTPMAGQSVPNGTAVKLIISQGPQPVSVPKVVGYQLEEAMQALLEAGLTGNVSERRQDDSLPRGQVLSQSPPPGQNLPKDSVVSLVISDGPANVLVPNVTGQKAKDAKKLLEQAGFTVVIDKMMGGPMGIVRSQDPGGGQPSDPSSTVTLHVF